MDFVVEAPFDGRRLRTLPVVDHYTSECPAIDVGHRLKEEDRGEVGNGRSGVFKLEMPGVWLIGGFGESWMAGMGT